MKPSPSHPPLADDDRVTPVQPPGPRRTLLFVAAAVVVLALLGWLIIPRAPPPATAAPSPIAVDAAGVTLRPDAPQWKYVELAVAKVSPPLPALAAPGRVDLDEKRTANVGTPLPGRIDEVKVRLGDGVKKGAPLFSVRSGAFAELDRDVEVSRQDVEVKRRVAQRSRELLALAAVPEKDVLASEAELKNAELGLRAVNAKQRSLSVSSGGDNLFWVRAPREGTVVELDITVGQEVTPEHDKPLVRISTLDEVRVLADVQEADTSDLKVGGAAKIRTQVGNLVRPGEIEHISEVIDPHRRTVEVRVRATNADRALRPNAFVEVTLEPGTALQRVRVPIEAVVSEGSKSLVFVARGPGRLETVEVVTGRQAEGEVEIKSGLEPGTRYVARGAILLLNQVDLLN